MFGRLLRRWAKFNAVGAMGVAVQLGALSLLRGVFLIHYLTATALAVESAVLHNFVWHERWTWRERTRSGHGVWWRLLRFHLTNGLVSLITNLAIMRLLVGRLHMQYLVANLLSIAAGALANFFLSEWLVFPAADEKRLTKANRA